MVIINSKESLQKIIRFNELKRVYQE